MSHPFEEYNTDNIFIWQNDERWHTRYDSALWTLFFFLLFLLNNMLNILFIYCLNDVGFFACKWNWSFFSLNNCIMMNWSAGICVHLSAAVCQYGFSLRSSCHAKHHSCSSAPLFPSVLWCQNSLILPGGNHCTLFGYYVYKQCTVLHLFFISGCCCSRIRTKAVQ